MATVKNLEKVKDLLDSQLQLSVNITYKLQNFIPNLWGAENSIGVFYSAEKGTDKVNFAVVVDLFYPMLRHNFLIVPPDSSLLEDIQKDVNDGIHYINNSSQL